MTQDDLERVAEMGDSARQEPTKTSPKQASKNSIYQKLHDARAYIRSTKVAKEGRNEYSKYDYFTPEQVESLVAQACDKTKTLVLCNFEQDELGYYQTLELVDLEDPTSRLSFRLRTEKGELKATNATQQMGGTDTYSERYIKMKVFQIKDNNLDFDSQDNTKAEEPTEKPASEKQKELIKKLAKEKGRPTPDDEWFENLTMNDAKRSIDKLLQIPNENTDEEEGVEGY